MPSDIHRTDVSNYARVLAGAATGRWVFGGPRSVALDTSVACNADCIMCWTHSPLMQGAHDGPSQQREGDEPRRQPYMDWEVLETIIRESAAMGTSLAVLGETGEPTLHPHFERSLDLMIGLGIRPLVMTNGLSADQKRAEGWAQRQAHFRFSLHAGDVETWLRVHPSGTAVQFEHLSQVIRTLSGAGRPRVSVINVIQRANFRNLGTMLEHAHQLGVSEVSFSPVRALPELSETVLTSEEEEELDQEILRCLPLAKGYRIRTNLRNCLGSRRFTRSGIVHSGSLWEHIPCYMGWVIAMFAVDGSVMPCENSQLCMGRATEQKFEDIWRSQRYQAFRRQANRMPMTGEFVPGCTCDDCHLAGGNIKTHRRLGRRLRRFPQPWLQERPDPTTHSYPMVPVAGSKTGTGSHHSL
ncbi:MAG TPA: radical SAM protein [Anaerolineae bacterium]|nr:radical SAM protein [Anaerolineae bacterium]